MDEYAEGPYYATSIDRSNALLDIQTWFETTTERPGDMTLLRWLRSSYVGSPTRQDPIFFIPSDSVTDNDRRLNVSDAVLAELKRRVKDTYDALVKIPRSNKAIKTTSDTKGSVTKISRVRLGKTSTVTLPELDYRKLYDAVENNLKNNPATGYKVGETYAAEQRQLTDAYIYQILKRYTSPFSIYGYNPKLPAPYYRALEALGVRHHILSSPLASYFPTFGSMFPDLDKFTQSVDVVVGDLLLDRSYQNYLKEGRAGSVLELNLMGLGYVAEFYFRALRDVITAARVSLTCFVVYDRYDGDTEGGVSIYDNRLYVVLRAADATPPDDTAVRAALGIPAAAPPSGPVAPATPSKPRRILPIPPLEVNGRITLPIITRFEKGKILGERAEQLAKNAKPLVDVSPSQTNMLSIAEREYKTRRDVFPIDIVRPLPNGTVEIWKVSELQDPEMD